MVQQTSTSFTDQKKKNKSQPNVSMVLYFAGVHLKPEMI